MSLQPRAIESLERRRLFADFTLDIDESLSQLTASGTVNGFAIGADDTTVQIDGTLNVSSTARGIKFLDGSDVTISRPAPSSQSFTFVISGRSIELSDFGNSFSSRRIGVTNGRFSTSRISTVIDAATVTDGGAVVRNFNGAVSDLDYSIGRVRTGDGKLRLEIPFAFTVATIYTVNGTSQTLNVTVTGQLVARGGEGATGASLAAPTSAKKAEKDRVVADVMR